MVTPRHGKASAFVFTVFPFVVQEETLSATACNGVKSQTVSTSFTSSIQIEYLLIKSFLTTTKTDNPGDGVLMTHFRVETEVCTIWSISNLKIVQNEGDWEPFSQQNNRSL